MIVMESILDVASRASLRQISIERSTVGGDLGWSGARLAPQLLAVSPKARCTPHDWTGPLPPRRAAGDGIPPSQVDPSSTSWQGALFLWVLLTHSPSCANHESGLVTVRRQSPKARRQLLAVVENQVPPVRL
jgi:hypothetical protein